MKLIAIMSSKGGVGKTTVAASLSRALADAGHPVLAIDLDPQNCLRLHFGHPPAALEGISRAALTATPWQTMVFATPAGVRLLPFGAINEPDQRLFQGALEDDPDWLLRNLVSLGLAPDCFVIMDTPPGASVFLRHALRHAHLALAVILPDAASYASIPKTEELCALYGADNDHLSGPRYVINQSDQTRQFHRDVADVVEAIFSTLPVDHIHQDQAVSEALGCQKTVQQQAPHSQATSDFSALAVRLALVLES